MTTLLAISLGIAMSIVLGNRRITMRQTTWWAVNGIAVGLFLLGRGHL
jgi:hypothetical protein